MTALLQWLFGTARFVPHGVCLLWRPDLVAIHVIADTLIALSYFAIPGAIWWFVRRREDLAAEHRRIALLFVAFITACGLTHVVAVVTLWQPYYGLQALVKAFTAAVSLTTACLLPFLVPKLLAIPSPAPCRAPTIGCGRRWMRTRRPCANCMTPASAWSSRWPTASRTSAS